MKNYVLHSCFLIYFFIYQSFIVHAKTDTIPAGLKKIAPVLKQTSFEHLMEVQVIVSDMAAFKIFIKNNNKIRIINEYPSVNILQLEVDGKSTFEQILQSDDILFVDRLHRKPKAEISTNFTDLTTNKVTTAHHRFPLLNGNGLVLSIKEESFDKNDIDFRGRIVPSGLSATRISTHASIMATMAAGGGNSYFQGKGVAWAAGITSSSFANLLPDADESFKTLGITVQNHSYGTGIENYYGVESFAYDVNCNNNPALLHIFSAGNMGDQNGSETYANVPFANLTGQFKMSKNTLSVGAVDSVGAIEPLSSKGPAYDGRVKPELVAYGGSGSSGAAAIVSGVALLLQQIYQEKRGTIPPTALIKSVLINSAEEVGLPGLDFESGYGNVHALRALETIEKGHFFERAVAEGAVQYFTIQIPSNIQLAKITLAWNDPAASAGASKALINDLDLELAHPASNTQWLPWVLNPFPHPDSLLQRASRKVDRLNNVEQITIENPVPGDYIIAVKGFQVNTGLQTFALAYQLDTMDRFEWHFPTRHDLLRAAEGHLLRWENRFSENTGSLAYKLVTATDWTILDTAVDVSKKQYQWKTPDLSGNILLRLRFGTQTFLSDTITITQRLLPLVGFNCENDLLFYWNRLPDVAEYEVYEMGERYLRPVALVPDTFFYVEKSASQLPYFAVAPIIAGKKGLNSYTFDYRLQGVACYIRSFFAILDGSAARLELALGTSFGLKALVLEKQTQAGFQEIQFQLIDDHLSFSFSDPSLKEGVNTYRVKLILENGEVLYSALESVYYFPSSDYIVFPNPVQYPQAIGVLQKEVSDATLYLYDAMGKKIQEYPMNKLLMDIPTALLARGVYFIQIREKGKQLYASKILLR